MSKPYIALRSIGMMGTKKRSPIMEYSGQIEADGERPLSSLMLPILRDVLPLVRYDSKQRFTEDIATLKRALDQLEYKDA